MDDNEIKKTVPRPKIFVKAEGDNVGDARLSASDFAEIIKRTQQALQRIGQVLYGGESKGKGRKKRDIEELCELFMVDWQRGSAVAVLELAIPPRQLNLFGYIGEQSLDAFIDGMEELSKEDGTLPRGFDTGVLQTCEGLSRVFHRGINNLTFQLENGRTSKAVTYNTKIRERVREFLGGPVDLGLATRVGRLEVLNGHSGLAGNLYEHDGTRWICHFKPEHFEYLSDVWMHTVQVKGQAIVEPGKERTLRVESIVVAEDELEAKYVKEEGIPFWKSVSLDELIEEQGVKPVKDLDEIAALWPSEEDAPEEILQYFLNERQESRNPNN